VSALTVTRALAVTGPTKVVVAYTVRRVVLPLMPMTVAPCAVRVLPAVTAALKDATAFTVRVWLPLLLPKTVLPFTLTGPEISSSTHSIVHAYHTNNSNNNNVNNK